MSQSLLIEKNLATLSDEAWVAIENAKLVLCDLDGCIAINDVLLDGASELVRRAGKRLVVVSNNSTSTAIDLAMRLREQGVNLGPESIYLAGEVAVRTIAMRHPRSRVMIVGSGLLKAMAMELGLTVCDDEPEVVLLARDDSLSINRIQQLVDLLTKGPTFYVTNPDLYRPGLSGSRQIETGALHLLLQAVIPDVHSLVIGKPAAEFFFHILSNRAVNITDSLMIGDTFDTDIQGAEAIGMRSIWLKA